MATAGGTPPTGVTPKPKREFTPEQKRTFAGLGVVGALFLIVGLMALTGQFGGKSTAPVPVSIAPSSGDANSASGAMNAAAAIPTTGPNAGFAGGGGGAGSGGTAVAATSGALGKPVVFVTRSRIDPFQPVYVIPPAAKPTPTPIPVRADPRVNVPLPSGFGGGDSLTTIADPRVRAAVAAPLNIGLPFIPSITTVKGPRDPFPQGRTSGGGDTGTAPQQSYDKRLAGVIIGDGVRALLELPSGEQRVVQPGDEVEGIRILNIERFRQGDRTITRMLVRDTDGSQRFVELRPSTQQQAGSEGGGQRGSG